MTFKTRKISRYPRLHLGRRCKNFLIMLGRGLRAAFLFFTAKNSSRKRSYAVGALMLILAVFVVIRAMIWAYDTVSTFNPKSFLFGLEADLKKDANGYTNLLLLGTGGPTHDGIDLVDTIMVASIDYEKNAVTLFSIPRDFYVNSEYSSRINEIYRDNKTIYGEAEALGIMEKAVGKVAGLDMQYYAKVDFKAFTEVVDSVGGVTVEVDQDLVDPYYPNATEDGYETFEIRAGTHTLDGETALKFVRSRKTTSDFDRAARQQKVLIALREKALSKDILGSPRIIKRIYSSVSENLVTDLSLREMVALAGYAMHMDRSRLIAKVIHDDPSREGGLLYTPPREQYNGAFVLLPVGDGYNVLHKYTDLIFSSRDMFLNPPKIEILNGTKEGGLAGSLKERLVRFGFNIVLLGNATEADGSKKLIQETAIQAYRWKKDGSGNLKYEDQATLDALSQWVKGKIVSAERQGEGPDITITLGLDFLQEGK